MRTILFAVLLFAQDTSLSWKFKKDQTFTITLKNRATTRVSWDGKQSFKEERIDEAAFKATVTSVDDQGAATLRLIPISYVFDVDRGEFRITVKSKRLDTGAPDMTVHVQADKLAEGYKKTMDDIFRTAFKDLYKKLSIEITVDKRGAVTGVKAEGDYFEDIEETSVTSQVMLAMAREMIDREELSTTLAGQAFLAVPADAPKVGDSWPMERSLSLSGIGCEGKGKATLQSASDGFLQLQDKTKYALDAARFGNSVKKFAELVNPELQVSSTMEAERTWDADATWWFNQSAGRAETFNCKGKFEVEGQIKGTLKGQDVQSKLKVEREVTLGVTWQ